MTDDVEATTPDPEDGSAPSAGAARSGAVRPAGELVVAPVDQARGDHTDELVAGEPVEEAVEGVPVLVQARPLAPARYAALPAVQAVAVAATGFLAGAAALAFARRHAARKLLRSRTVPRRPVDMLPVVGSRTFIVDIHLLAKPGE